MPTKKVNGEKNRLGIYPRMTMARIVNARQRAFASNKPCHTAQSISEKIDELAKRLADPADEAARDDTLVFLSYRYSSLTRETILKVKTLLEQHDEQARVFIDKTPDQAGNCFCEITQPVRENIVNLTERLSELSDIKEGEEPLWYKIYLHTELNDYAQVR